MRRAQILLLWVAIVAAGFLIFDSGAELARGWWPTKSRSVPAVAVAPANVGAPPSGWTAVAKTAMPAVVNISSSKTVRGPGGSAPFFADPFFRFFPTPERAPRRERSLGSGVIVTADGYVLTNSHVVEGADQIQVTLDDRREFKAKLIGADPKSDLAVLKLPGSGFTLMTLGDSSKVEVAEVVLAIGNPFGLDRTVTMGIVSAVGRANLGITDYEDFIQTDAAINPGNSGGALVNVNGVLIGINTAIFSESGGYQGIGFAVPVNMARQVMEQLIARGRLSRGYLGVTVQELTPAMARGLGLSIPRGVLVADVSPDGPAARAGLKRGDVIVAIDGQPVTDVGHFRNHIAGKPPGTKEKLTILRDGREQSLEVAVAEAPERGAVAATMPARPEGPGLEVSDLTPEMARRLGLPPGMQGAVVVRIQPGGVAAEAGLRPGDVVQEVNRRPVRSAKDFTRALAETGGQDDLVMVVNRGGTTAYVIIERG